METYNISVAVTNESIGRTDTYSWDWMVTNSSSAADADDIAFVIQKSPSVNTTGNVSQVQFNTTDNINTDDEGLSGSIVGVSFNTSSNATGLILKIEVLDKSAINESETGFSAGSVYQYLDISVNNRTLANSMSYNRSIEFRVLNELNDGTLLVSSVNLKHKNSSTWESYTPELLSNNGNYSYFIVRNVSGFSPFAINANYGYDSASVSDSDDGLPYYWRELLKELRERAATEESDESGETVDEQVNAGTSASEGSGKDGNVIITEDTEESTISEENSDDKQSSGLLFPVLIILIVIAGLFFAKQKKK
jgi:PGF-pre-PGF domain-containing protein